MQLCYLVGFRISLSLSREGAIFRDEILVFRDFRKSFLVVEPKKWCLLSSRIPGIENSCWTLISSAICQQILSSLWSLSRWSLPYSSSSSLIFDQENAGIWRTSQLILFGQRSTNKCNSLSTNQDSEDVVDDGEDPSPAPRHCRHGGGHRAGWGGTFDWWLYALLLQVKQMSQPHWFLGVK